MNGDQSTHACRTFLISDEPGKEDLFKGAHNRVATSILDIIETERGGRSIGLEGGYGTGKTTVVNILLTKIKDRIDYTIVPFDAWTHEGDPLRRTFLETVIKHLRKLHWIDSVRWQQRLDEIAQRREVRTTKTIPSLTRLGKAVGFSIFLVPVGLAFINSALREPLTVFDTSLPLSRKFLIGVTLSLAPLLVLLAVWFARTVSNLRFWRSTAQPSVRHDESAGLWALLFNKAITEEQTETTKTPNPTSIEFEETFKEVMAEALSYEHRRLILVIDNLDRIEPSAALSIWSTLQTFIGHSQYGRPEWFERLWLLILYDPRSIRLLWHTNDNSLGPITEPLVEDVLGPAPKKTHARGDVASSFLEKAFQVRFRVPFPVLSDWHQYLIDLLKKALPDHDESEFHGVYRVLETYLSQTGQAATVRKLKVYVNQIGTVHRQWFDAFPLSHVAYYALHQSETDNSVQWFLTHPEGNYEGISNEDVRDSLAALTFNIEQTKAMQLLLGAPIKIALSEGDVSQVLQLSKFETGFWEVLERAVTTDREWIEGIPARLANAAYCLSESSLLKSGKQPETVTVARALSERASQVEAWSSFGEQKAKGIVALCTWSVDRQNALNILKAVIYGLTDDKGSGKSIDTALFVAELKLIREGLSADELYDLFREGIIGRIQKKLTTKRKDGPINKDSAPSGFELRTLLIALFELSLIDERANESLSEVNSSGFTRQYLLWAIRNFNVGNDYGQPTPEIAAWALFLLVRDMEMAKSLLTGDKDEHELILRVLRIEVGEPKKSSYNDRLSLVPEIFSKILSEHADLEVLFTLYDTQRESEAFVVRCLRIILNEWEHAQRLFTAEVIVNRWSFLHSHLSTGEAENLLLVLRAINWESEIDAVYEAGFSLDRVPLYNIILRSLEANSGLFKEWCKRGLQIVSREEWDAKAKEEPKRDELLDFVRNVSEQAHSGLDLEAILERMVDW